MHESNKIAILIVSLTASFLTPFMVASVNIAIPRIGDDLNVGAVYLGWIQSSYLLSSVIFLIPFGKLGDIYGRKKFFYYGIIIITLSSIMAALSFHWLILLLSRTIHGIGASMTFGTGVAMLTSVFPLQKRGAVLGINVSFTYLGLMLGPVIGGIITHFFGWRALFWGIVPVGIIVLLIVKILIIDEIKTNNPTYLDKIDLLMYGVSLLFIMISVSNITKFYGILWIAIGIITFIIFLKREKNAKEPILPINLFVKNRVFAFSNLAALINYSATYGVGFIMSLYLQKVRGLTPDKAGFIIIVQPIMMAMLSPITGKLSDRLEPRILATIGMTLITTGLFLLLGVNYSTSYYVIILYLTIMGIGFSLFSSPNTNAVMSSVDKKEYGIASSTIGTMRLLGQTLSMGIIVLLISLILGDKKIETGSKENIIQIMHRATITFGVLSCFGIPLSFIRGNLRSVLLDKAHPSDNSEH